MASTHGRTRKPLPPSLVDGLRSLGFYETTTTPDVPWLFRHPKHPKLTVQATASNIPGDDAVIARWSDGDDTWQLRIRVDMLLQQVAGMVDAASAVNRFMTEGADHEPR